VRPSSVPVPHVPGPRGSWRPDSAPRRRTPLALVVALLLLVTGALIAVTFAPKAARAAATNTPVTTYRNDNGRTGQYPNETALNTSNVNVSQFGKRVSYPVDGQLYAQPLYVPNLTIGGSVHNVVFAATENDSVYAFDADATSAGAPLWKVSLLPGGATAVPNSAVNCSDLTPVIGITGTPVIDTSTNTLYVVSYDDEGGNLVYRLHALNILTGQDKSPAIVLQGSAPGTGPGGSGGTVSFNAALNRQRAGLVLANGKVYIAFSSFCDNGNYHGWILSYTYNGSSFQQANAYDVDPNGLQGGIWGGDAGLVADSTGNLYYVSGNGTFDANTGGSDYGDSFVRLNAALQVQDYFTPFNQSCLNGGDQDLGAGGPLLIPGANALTGAGKEGRVYVVSTTNMGKYTADPNLTCNGSAEENRTDIDKVQQELAPGLVGPDFSTPAFWNGPSGQYVYYTSVNGPTWAFSWNGTKLSTTPTSTSASGNGGTAVVSSNGTAAGTGIVWKIDYGSVLHAYDASNLATELYNSSQNQSRDGLSGYVKFSSPVVTNGQVFVGLSSSLAIFGLLGGTPPPPPPPGGFQINSGGPAVSPFAADEDFTGGATSATTHAIDTSAVTSPAPQAVYQSNRYGNFTYALPGLTANANYTVRLHFAEEYWTTAGSRVFNVTINGKQVLTNFDILAAAGAEYKAVVEQFTVPADSSGRMTIQFTTVKDNAQVNAIEVLSGGTPPPPPPPPPGAVQINSGGPAVAPFSADADFTGGATAGTGNAINTSGVTSPAPQAVYQTNRYGNFSYAIGGLTANANYTVRLHFAEEYWTTAGSRVFNVTINGKQVLTNFDILAAAGAEYKAVVEQFTIPADSTGKITLQFATVKDNAQVNAIEILS
jgi:Malectin domain